MNIHLSSKLETYTHVPLDDPSVRPSCDQGIFLDGHFCDGFVMPPNDFLGLSRCLGVQIVDVAAQGDGDKVVTAPEASQLLVINSVAHLKGGQTLASFGRPYLASLVA